MERNEEQLKKLRVVAESHAEAMMEASRSMTALWRSQVEMAIASGDEDKMVEVLGGGETGLWDNNTNCPCGGGGTAHW